MKRNIAILLSLILIQVSCKKEEIKNESTYLSNFNNSSFVSIDEEARYDSVLTAAYWGILELSQNQEFRDSVNSACQREFDGDVNVLFKQLDLIWPTLNADLVTSITNNCSQPYLYTKFVDEIIDGFDYFGEKRYPQIYIPFDDIVNINVNPMICLNLEDDLILPGHKIVNASVVSQGIDESYASENLVWVISANESVLSESDYDNIGDFIPYGDSVVSPTQDTTVISITTGSFILKTPTNIGMKKSYKVNKSVGLRLQEFKPSTSKENWGNGKDEISIIGGKWVNTCINLERKYAYKCQKFKENEIGKYKAIKNGNEWASFVNTLIPLYQDVDMNAWCIVFEEDNRRKYERTFNPTSFDGLPDCSDSWTFLSKQVQYGDMNFHWIWWINEYASPFSRIINCNLNGGNNNLKFKVWRD